MTEREQLLSAIKASPKEDMPRLLYADWLEEFGTTDLDNATVDFIRMSCDLKNGGRRHSDLMPRAVYPWLEANKYRLIPSVVAMSVDSRDMPKKELGGGMKGRYLVGYIRVPNPDNLTRLCHTFSLTLEFHRGFVCDVTYCCNTLWYEIGAVLQVDQPLCGKPANIHSSMLPEPKP